MAVFEPCGGILLHGLAYAMVLYLISVGLSVTMGLLGIANLAHGVFAMAGGYLAMTLLSTYGWSFAPAMVAAFFAVAALGAVAERLLYSRLHDATDLEQVLFSIGAIFMGSAVFHYFYGPLSLRVDLPEALSGSISIFGFSFPVYRALLIGVGFSVFIALLLSIDKTLVGARIRATVDNAVMARTIGINTGLVYTGVFALGSGLAALGGALGAEIIPLFPGYANAHLTTFLIVVAIGGLGTTTGPFLSAILIGIADTACKILAPEIAAFFTYSIVFLLLSIKPNGLFGAVR